MTTAASIAPIHPGEILAEEYLGPLGITQHRLSVAISVPPRRINEILHGTRRISADTALRLSRYFGTSERFWTILQVTSERSPVEVPLTVTESAMKLGCLPMSGLRLLAIRAGR
ncbi:MAG: addiction module antidote protein, HigA family [Pseudonocardiales bacterium]|nr:MAG: addiction module antidote protein, HigA family [Pseudonocardiales bacterium]